MRPPGCVQSKSHLRGHWTFIVGNLTSKLEGIVPQSMESGGFNPLSEKCAQGMAHVLGWKFQTIPWNHQHIYPKYPHWREHIQGSLCQFADSTKPETSGRSPIFLWQTIPKVCACLYITFKTFCGSIEGGFTTTTKIDCFSISSHWRRIILKKHWKQGIVSQDHSNTENERLKPDKGDSLPEFSFNFVSLFQSVYFPKGVENQECDC